MFFPFFGVSLWLFSRYLFYFFFIFLVYLSGYTSNVGYLNKCVCHGGVFRCWANVVLVGLP